MGTHVDVGLQPRFVTAAFDSVWVSSYFDGTITRIDPETDKAVAEITTDQGPQIMAEAGGLLWVSCTDTDTVQAIDPETNEVVATLDTPVTPDGLAFDGTTLWVATELGPELAGIDPATQEIVAYVVVAEHGLINANQVMAFEEGSLWLPILDDGTVLRVRRPAIETG
jgi:DNA-binding beta-propeller fold protein YncE